MRTSGKHLEPDKEIVRKMIALHCRDQHHHPHELCPDCQELSAYAEARLDQCPYGEQKPSCSACPIHCYRPQMREKMRGVMRYAGPRMMLRHPLLALKHAAATIRQRVGSAPAAGRNPGRQGSRSRPASRPATPVETGPRAPG